MIKASPFDGIQLVLFDLDGTLHKVRPTSVEAFINYSVDLGLTMDAEARLAIVRWNQEHWAKDRALINYDEGHLTPDAFVEKHLRIFVRGLGMKGMIEEEYIKQMVARFRDDFSPESYLEPDAPDLLRRLRGAGLRLGLVSNRDQPLDEAASELGITQYFDFTLAGGQVNSWKPDTAIFHHALKMGGGVLPAEALHIGDNYYADVVGARKAGIQAILIDEEGAFPEAKSECLVVSHFSDLEYLLPA